MLFRKLVGGTALAVLTLVGVSSSASATEAVADSGVYCGVNTADYGSGLLVCDGDVISWVRNSSTYIEKTSTFERTRTVFDSGVVSELIVDKAAGTITSYIG